MFGETVGTILVSGSNSSGYLLQRTNQTTGTVEYDSTRVFHVTLLSWGTAPSALQLYAGGSAPVGTLQVIVGGTGTGYLNPLLQHIETDVDFGVFGHTFKNGCYYVADGNIVSAAIICKADKF